MKKSMKKILSFVMAVALVFTMGVALPQTATSVMAASSPRINKNSVNKTGTYKPGSPFTAWLDTISISGCEKASQIKNLKSSNKSVAKVEAGDGCIRVIYRKKPGKVKISCTVKGKKLSTTYTVKKFVSPLSTFKLGSSNFVSKYGKDDAYSQKKAFKNQTLKLKAKKGWTIQKITVANSSPYTVYTVNKSSLNKKISMTSYYSFLDIVCYNSKTKTSEHIKLYRNM